MKMIDKREKARAAKAPPPNPVTIKWAPADPVNADAALLLLGITQNTGDDPEFARVASWFVQAALDRRRGVLTRDELQLVRNTTLSPHEIRWPKATGA